MNRPVEFLDVSEDEYPFTVRYYRGGEVVHEIFVAGPGVVRIPALGRVSHVAITLPDGSVVEAIPR